MIGNIYLLLSCVLATVWLSPANAVEIIEHIRFPEKRVWIGGKPPAHQISGKIRFIPPEKIRTIVAKIAKEQGVSEDLVLAVIKAESGFNSGAVSPKGAQGIMQLIPATARRFNVDRPFDAEDNIRGGTKYLAWLLDKFNGNVRLAVAGYNAGENSVQRYKGVPPFSETQAYVKTVLAMLD